MPPTGEAPPQIEPKSLGDYLEVMSKAVFQSGMSWKVVEAKWPSTREAFHDFQIGAVAAMGEEQIDELATDTRVIRNRRKLAAVVSNAQRMIELDEEHGEFRSYLRSHNDFWETVADIRKQFKFMGNVGTYFFLWVVGEEVIPHEEFVAAHHK